MAAQKVTPFAANAQDVQQSFVHEYYTVLQQQPQMLYKFYQDGSVLTCPDADGVMTSVTTLERINEMICSLDYQNCKVEIKTADAQKSYNHGVVVLVTGFLIGKDNQTRPFMQTFFLAPQIKGYYVLNDLFMYADCTKSGSGIGEISRKNYACGCQTSCPGSVSTTYAVQQRTSKKSYSSVLSPQTKKGKMEVMPAATSKITATKSENEPVDALQLPPLVPSLSPAGSGSKVVHDKVEGYSIHIVNLPPRVAVDKIETEFKKFGPIKPNGVVVKSRRGKWFGFVEFQDLSSMESALQASPISIGGRPAIAVVKRGGTRFRRHRGQVSNRGAFQNENFRGCGNFVGGQLFERRDIDTRNVSSGHDGIPRGGYSSEGYQLGRLRRNDFAGDGGRPQGGCCGEGYEQGSRKKGGNNFSGHGGMPQTGHSGKGFQRGSWGGKGNAGTKGG